MAILLRRRKLGRTSCREIGNFSKLGITAIRNDLLDTPRGRRAMEGQDILIRWGCTSQVDVKKVINKVEAIHQVNDKLVFRRTLTNAGLCPRTWFDVHDPNVTFPCVARPSRHAQGRNLHVCNNREELGRACARYADYYISELINKVAEYRVFVVQGRVACVAQKTPGNPQDVAWNVARGGRFDNVRWDDWPLKAVRVAVEAFELSSLDFGGVDVMVDHKGQAYVLEINSAPSLTSPYRQECMAKCLDWLVEKGTARIPRIKDRGGYHKFIHPAVCDKAILVGGE